MAKNIIVRLLQAYGEEVEIEPKLSKTDVKKAQEKAERNAKFMKSYIAKRVWEQVKGTAVWTADKYLGMTENYKMQTLVENAVSTIDSAVSIGTAIGMGFAVGGPVGAAVFGAISATSQGISKFKQYIDASQQIVNNAYGNHFYAARAGYDLGGHGTEN